MAIYNPEYPVNGKEIAVINTNKGSITVQLTGVDTPIHVSNFIELALKDFYNDLKFHRLEPGFVVQGGCPNTRELTREQVRMGSPLLGTGGPGYTIKGEWTSNPHNFHKDGTLAMARSAAPDSAGSQFYFCLGPQAFLDANYTVFGNPVDEESLKVIHSLEKGDEIVSIEILNVS